MKISSVTYVLKKREKEKVRDRMKGSLIGFVTITNYNMQNIDKYILCRTLMPLIYIVFKVNIPEFTT